MNCAKSLAKKKKKTGLLFYVQKMYESICKRNRVNITFDIHLRTSVYRFDFLTKRRNTDKSANFQIRRASSIRPGYWSERWNEDERCREKNLV